MDSRLSERSASRERVERLHGQLSELLLSLDEAELHAAAAYVSMAVDSINRDYPDLSATR
jgi:hypothetical protein